MRTIELPRIIRTNFYYLLGTTFWIDVCPKDANLLASGGSDKSIKIFDRRVSKVTKTLDNVHSSKLLLPTI